LYVIQSKTLIPTVMKKFIIMVIVLSLITACQKKRVEDTGSGGSAQCISLEDYYKETTTNGKAAWLKEYCASSRYH
jgi:hypothetical protein